MSHTADAREYRRQLDREAEEIGFNVTGFRSWMRHPIANAVFGLAAWVPHRPWWVMEECTVGPVNHEGWSDAYDGWLYVRCSFCGMERDSSGAGSPSGETQ